MTRDTRQAAVALQASATRLLRMARSDHAKSGLGSAQYSALAVLYDRGPLPLTELARIERVAHPTMSRVVAGLAKLNAVQRREDGADRRSKLVELSPEGIALYERVCASRVSIMAAILGQMSDATVAEIIEVVGKVTDAMEASSRRD